MGLDYRDIQAALEATHIGATVGNWASRAHKASVHRNGLNKYLQAYRVRTRPTERINKVVAMLRAGPGASRVSPLLGGPSPWEP